MTVHRRGLRWRLRKEEKNYIRVWLSGPFCKIALRKKSLEYATVRPIIYNSENMYREAKIGSARYYVG